MPDAIMLREQWRPVHEHAGLYDVSDFGRVWSRLSGQFLKPSINRKGYEEVKLSRGGRSRGYRIHVLILEAFDCPRPEGQQGRHLNGTRTANGLLNLAWGTGRENVADTLRHGRHNMQAKTTCPQSHDLVEPNLVPAAKRRGRRDCLACRRAHETVERAEARGEVVDFVALADENYRQIVAGEDPRHDALHLAELNECLRRHPLAEPNLTAQSAAGGRRQCLACKRARSDVRDARRRSGQVLDINERAAWHYAQIMGEAA